MKMLDVLLLLEHIHKSMEEMDIAADGGSTMHDVDVSLTYEQLSFIAKQIEDIDIKTKG